VPIPEGQIVNSAEHAWEVAVDMGLPVVVKPTDGNHGRGVSLDLSTQEDVALAYDLAQEQGSQVMVEHHIPGEEHRLLVVGGKVVAASRGESAWIVGDGKATVLELIESQINADPRRGDTEDHPLCRILAEDPESAARINLQRQGLTCDSVLTSGQRALVVSNGNLAVDCTAQVHPKVAAAAALAARVVGLDIAGVDVVARDIAQPLQAQDGAIVEVNAGPGLLMHLKPAAGEAQPVGQAIVAHLFPAAEDGRIPIVGVSGVQRNNTSVARLIAWLLHLNGRHVGLACSDGIFLGRRQVERTDATRHEAAQRLLLNRTVEAAVIESTPHTILGEGLPYDRCTVGVVTEIGQSPMVHLGNVAKAFDVSSVEQMIAVLRTQIDVVLAEGCAVLNAEDPHVLSLADYAEGEVLLYAIDADHPALTEHVARGGRAVGVRDAHILLLQGQSALKVVRVDRLPLGLPPLMSMLAGVAAGCALGMSADLIRAGLVTFDVTTTAADAIAASIARRHEAPLKPLKPSFSNQR
jgi:cyanophycin synthetase